MKTTIPYTTSETQIQKLKKNNLLIEDDNFASQILSMNGYSNLIKSYRDPYVLSNDGKKHIAQELLSSKFIHFICLTKIYEIQ